MKNVVVFVVAFVLGLVIGPVSHSLLFPTEARRLKVPVKLCFDVSSSCDLSGEHAAGTVLDVDPKGFALVAIRVEPGVIPRDIEPAPDSKATRFQLRSEGLR